MTEVKMTFPPALWEDLAKVDPLVVAKNSGADYEQGRFTINFLEAPFVVDVHERVVTGPPNRSKADFQKALVLVVHLAHVAINPPPGPAGRLIGTMEVPGGAMFFRGPHVISTSPLEEAYATTPEALVKRAFSLGALMSDKYLFTWRVLPMVNLACVFNSQDEEFPAKATYLVDAHAHYYMPLDALWGLFNVATLELLPKR
jgi:hypothetical protein